MEVITETQENNHWKCLLKGNFTFADSSRFQVLLDDIKAVQPNEVTIDLSDTVYIDSAALGMLLVLKEATDEMKTKVIIAGARDQVLKVLKLSRFEELFTLAA